MLRISSLLSISFDIAFCLWASYFISLLKQERKKGSLHLSIKYCLYQMSGSLQILQGKGNPLLGLLHCLAASELHISTALLNAETQKQKLLIKHMHMLILRHILKDNLLFNWTQVQRRSLLGTVLGVLMKKAKDKRKGFISVSFGKVNVSLNSTTAGSFPFRTLKFECPPPLFFWSLITVGTWQSFFF